MPYQTKDGLAWLTMSRPNARNALNRELSEAHGPPAAASTPTATRRVDRWLTDDATRSGSFR